MKKQNNLLKTLIKHNFVLLVDRHVFHNASKFCVIDGLQRFLSYYDVASAGIYDSFNSTDGVNIIYDFKEYLNEK